MRIGMFGAHGTGKTSLARQYALETGVALVTGASRWVSSLGFPINEQATPESQAATSMARLLYQLNAGASFVSDRTLLDSVGYNKLMFPHWSDENLAQARFWYNTMDGISRYYMREYDLLVFVPISFELQADGVRSTAVKFQQDAEAVMLQLADDYGLVYAECPNGSVAERTEWLREVTGR